MMKRRQTKKSKGWKEKIQKKKRKGNEKNVQVKLNKREYILHCHSKHKLSFYFKSIGCKINDSKASLFTSSGENYMHPIRKR